MYAYWWWTKTSLDNTFCLIGKPQNKTNILYYHCKFLCVTHWLLKRVMCSYLLKCIPTSTFGGQIHLEMLFKQDYLPPSLQGVLPLRLPFLFPSTQQAAQEKLHTAAATISHPVKFLGCKQCILSFRLQFHEDQNSLFLSCLATVPSTEWTLNIS